MRAGRIAVLSAGIALSALAILPVASSGANLGCRPSIAHFLSSVSSWKSCYDTVDAEPVDQAAVRASLKLQTDAAAQATRQRLIEYVWRRPELPRERLPTEVRTDITDQAFAGLDGLSRIDMLVMSLEFGFRTRAYHFVPANGNGRAVIYHEGHDGSFRKYARTTISALLTAGFAVLAFDMPMRGLSSWPDIVDVPGLGPVLFGASSHWNLAILEDAEFTPLRLFMDPVLRGTNYLALHYDYQQIMMLGISGGGWATTVYAAIDPRITRSYPVAGTSPFFLRGRHPGSGKFTSDGDYEQRAAELYRRANYLDLYVLGSIGSGRRQIQILNKFDPCCFFGNSAEIYAPLVSAAVSTIGDGSFRLVIDDTHAQHAISQHALGLIVADAMAP